MIGRAEKGETADVNYMEIYTELKPHDEWSSSRSIEALADAMREELEERTLLPLEEARANRDEYLGLIEAAQESTIDGNYSLKPTMFGLLLDAVILRPDPTVRLVGSNPDWFRVHLGLWSAWRTRCASGDKPAQCENQRHADQGLLSDPRQTGRDKQLEHNQRSYEGETQLRPGNHTTLSEPLRTVPNRDLSEIQQV